MELLTLNWAAMTLSYSVVAQWIVVAVACLLSLHLYLDTTSTIHKKRRRQAAPGSGAMDPVDATRPLNAPCTGNFLARRGPFSAALPAVHVRVCLSGRRVHV